MDRARVLPQLADLDDSSRPAAGSKAATLSRLASRGFRVPPGFVVTAAAFAELGDALEEAVTAATDRIGAGRFAVRSSAAAEDLPSASFAGQYESFLGVERDGVADAVRRGFAAAATRRVAAYRAARTPDAGDAGMAILVQQMVDPVAAGVAFSANPLTGRDEAVVTAVRGLGEVLVSGESTGEHWVVGVGGVARTAGDDRIITAEQARLVAQVARRVAEIMGAPQDIEWALDGESVLHLLQARPMTALPEPVSWPRPGPGPWFRNFRLGEWLPEAMTPLFADWLLPQLEAGYARGMVDDARVSVAFRSASVNGWYYNSPPLPTLRFLRAIVLDSRGRAAWLLFNALVRVLYRPAAAHRAVLFDLEKRWRARILPRYQRAVEEAGGRSDPQTPADLVATVNAVAGCAGAHLWSLSVLGGSAWKMEFALARFWRKHLAGPLAGTSAGAAGHQVLLRGLPGAEPASAPHAVYSIDWFHPTAGEMRQSTIAGGAERTAAVAVSRANAEAACQAALRKKPRRRARFEALLAMAQRYAVLREEQSGSLTLGWPALRRCVHSLGEQLRADGSISDVDDVYFLTLGEIMTRGDLRASANLRRARWERQRRLIAPLTLGSPIGSLGDPIARLVKAARTTDLSAAGAIVGHPASPGRATGYVRVLGGPYDFDSFRQGEVLVARATAPAWTPLFALAAAVVTDGGSLAAHASLVAREYGIPAVVGTGTATSRLRTGQLVTVDGSAGVVILEVR